MKFTTIDTVSEDDKLTVISIGTDTEIEFIITIYLFTIEIDFTTEAMRSQKALKLKELEETDNFNDYEVFNAYELTGKKPLDYITEHDSTIDVKKLQRDILAFIRKAKPKDSKISASIIMHEELLKERDYLKDYFLEVGTDENNQYYFTLREYKGKENGEDIYKAVNLKRLGRSKALNIALLHIKRRLDNALTLQRTLEERKKYLESRTESETRKKVLEKTILDLEGQQQAIKQYLYWLEDTDLIYKLFKRTGIRTVAVSRNLIDSTYNSNYEILEEGQPSLFDQLDRQTKTRIVTEEGEKHLATEFLHTTQQESRLLSTIANLYYDKCDTHNGKPEARKGDLVVFPKGKQRMTAVLKVTPQELYKEYTGKSNPSGNERTQINKTLINLTKNRMFVWESNKELEKDYLPYIWLGETMSTEGTTEEEREQFKAKGLTSQDLGKADNLKIFLNPVFLGDWYMLRPRDIEEKTILLAEKNKISPALTRLRDYLMGILQRGKDETEIGEVALIYKLGLEKTYKNRGLNSPDIQDRIAEAISLCKKLKIINSYKKGTNRDGGGKYTFCLNKNFLDDYYKTA
jgi:hypothetical protein